MMVRYGQYFILSIYIAPSESNFEFHKIPRWSWHGHLCCG